MSLDAIRELVSRLHSSAASLAAIGAALDAKASGTPIDPALKPHLEAVLAAAGAADAMKDVTAEELRPLAAEIRAFSLLNLKLLSSATRTSGWEHTDDTLQATGELSSAFPHTLKKMIAPKLDGLSARLDAPGAAFLDIGTGVAMLAIEMAKLWPNLKIVGIDPWEPALIMATDNVKAAGMGARIELRQQAAQDLIEEEKYDLVWLPSAFVPGAAMHEAIARSHSALKNGGWILLATVRRSSDPLAGALSRMRLAQFGGWDVSPEESVTHLVKAGFRDVAVLPGPPNSPAAMIAGRK